ncbi:MAG: sigma-70 factor domain-containing protein [Thermoguttaceae bacterium]|jgi:hypothetical protein
MSSHFLRFDEPHVTDDPLRIYLMQIGKMALIGRPEELRLGRQIERARRRFRHAVLATDHVLQSAVALLQAVQDGRLRVDRMLDVSSKAHDARRRLAGVLGPNLHTLRQILARNGRDYAAAIGKRQPPDRRRSAWRRLLARRDRAVRLGGGKRELARIETCAGFHPKVLVEALSPSPTGRMPSGYPPASGVVFTTAPVCYTDSRSTMELAPAAVGGEA